MIIIIIIIIIKIIIITISIIREIVLITILIIMIVSTQQNFQAAMQQSSWKVPWELHSAQRGQVTLRQNRVT